MKSGPVLDSLLFNHVFIPFLEQVENFATVSALKFRTVCFLMVVE
uniref:Bm14252 n=1 Tax=Brugia malayi TaxID=6279 RepID=A0A1I9G6R1_BRUMA|nr:Bm14252 [Brugia malayi]